MNTHKLPIALSIGKNGLTAGAVQQLDMELEHREYVKINFLKAYADNHDIKEAATQLSMLTKSAIVEQIGKKLVLYRKQPKR